VGNEYDPKEEYRINIDMWKHYDNLRQEKNKTFLTANTILVAASGFLLEAKISDLNVLHIVGGVAVLGLVICVLWLLLQTINKAYIDHHMAKTRELESEKQQLANWKTFEKQKDKMTGIKKFPNTIDRLLSGSMALFWLGVALFMLKLPC